MVSFKFKELKTGFQGLDRKMQERLFALSCFQSDHVEAGFPIRIAEVERERRDALEELYGHNTWQKIRERGDVEAVLSTFEHGDALNYMLAWFLEDDLPRYACKPESGNNESEFDVTIFDQDISVCGIELKRAGSSNRISRYLEEHRKKCENRRDARNFLLVNLFPISNEMDSVRTTDLVMGYGPLSAKTHAFYQQERSYVANVAAPLYRDKNDVDPLREIRKELKEGLDIPS